MSLPPELRALCFRLSSTPVSDLPSLTPTLLSYVLRCQAPLSSPAVAAGKADASSAAVLVHKLKTQLSALLNGKSTEGRFSAVVLVKAVVEIGGWEVLNGSESWVRGLLSILGKPDPMSTKEMAVVALTKIYLMTHQYQTLVREITTPTLPPFITACLALVSSKSNKSIATSSLEETIFEALAMLVPRHTSIFRPFASQIRLVIRRYVAPTSSDETFVPLSVKESARRLHVVLHQTAAKNTGAEEWSKAVREFVKETHATADQVFRAVIEDWESNAGYSSAPVDVNRDLSGGGNAAEALPSWSGIFAGIERLVGLLEILAVYLKEETSAPVALPIGSLMDILNRMLSIGIPSLMSKTGASARLHPAIDREERDALCASLPQVYVAALQLIRSMSERLEGSFLSIAQAVFDQLVWIFSFGRHDHEFRSTTYENTAIVLMHIGQSLSRNQVGKCYDILRSCCKDLEVLDLSLVNDATSLSTKSRIHNADTFLRHIPDTAQSNTDQGTTLTHYARQLLCLSLSHLPQQYIDISMRSMVERTAILSHDKNAMLASVLNPFVGKNGKTLASILPHLTREYGNDATVEILLRPRMPLLPSATRLLNDAAELEDIDNDEDMLPPIDGTSVQQDLDNEVTNRAVASTLNLSAGPSREAPTTFSSNAPSSTGFGFGALPTSLSKFPVQSSKSILRHSQQASTDVEMGEALDNEPKASEPKVNNGGTEEEESSSDESVHLTMQLDTDSEDDD